MKDQGKVNSVEYNLQKRVLDQKLEDIINQKKEINDLKIREKYHATSNDPFTNFLLQPSRKKKRQTKDKLL